jgi:lipoprotein-anchoring transpeptidase ErfK/SrfK
MAGSFALLVIILAIAVKSCQISVRLPSGQPGSAQSLINEAKKLESEDDLLGARGLYQNLTSEYPNSREIMSWQKKVEDLNIKLLFSPVIVPGSIEYEIRPGDSLEKIAKDNKTTVELIMKSNGLSDEKIFPGKKIKVWTAPFCILVDKSQNTLILKTNEEVVKTYIVSTGANNCTPTGTFKIIEKIVNPPWYKPGGGLVPAGSPENILGTRWLGINKEGYGIHGTTEPKSLGKQVTAGCVRMSNTDVEELFSIVGKDTEVIVVD